MRCFIAYFQSIVACAKVITKMRNFKTHLAKIEFFSSVFLGLFVSYMNFNKKTFAG
jgi:hypothetical protein